MVCSLTASWGIYSLKSSFCLDEHRTTGLLKVIHNVLFLPFFSLLVNEALLAIVDIYL